MLARPAQPPYKSCESCPLQKKRQFVLFDSPREAKFALIGESPGTTEIIDRRPFVGPSGRLVNALLEELGINRDDLFIGNVSQCRAVGCPDMKPTEEIKELCGAIMANLMYDRGVLTVMSLGGVAMNYFLGLGRKESIMRNRSKVFTSRTFKRPDGEEFTFQVYPSFHPAAVLRRPEGLGDIQMDFERCFFPERMPQYVPGEYHIIDDLEQAISLMSTWVGQPVAFDLETSGYSPHDDYILCVAMSPRAGKAYVFTNPVIIQRAFWRCIKWLNDKDTVFVMHGGFFDYRFVYLKTKISLNVWDTMLGNYTFDERSGVHDLKNIAVQRFGFPDWDQHIRQYLKRKALDSYAKVPRDVLHKYAGYDADATIRLYDDLRERLPDKQLGLIDEILNPGIVALSRMSLTGISIDMEHWHRLYGVYTEIAERAKTFMQEYVDDPDFNPNSPKQAQHYIYDVFNMPTHDKSHQIGHHPTLSTGRTSQLPPRTTALDQLERLALDLEHSVWIRALIHYRSKRKAVGSYLKTYKPLESTGRIHPRFLAHSTRTGRLSSRDPNIMNAPHYGYIRQLVVPREGYILASVDYSQAELRVLAALAGDNMMAQIYRDGGDLHDIITTDLFGPDYSKRDRLIAKAVVFGIIYGRSVANIAETFGISLQAAKDYHYTFLGRFESISAWMEKQKAFALEHGYVEMPTGRRRRFGLITQSNVSEVQRQAINTPVQGTASDIMFLSLIRLLPYIESHGGSILFPLHDSILFELPVSHWKEMIAHIVDVMEAVPQEILDYEIPFAADCDVGWRWGNTVEFKRTRHPSGIGLLPIAETLKDYEFEPEDPNWWVGLKWDTQPWLKEELV